LGGYSELLGAGSKGKAGEDMHLLYRLVRRDKPVVYEPRLLVYHERQSRDRRLASRKTYGYGVGATCGLLLAAGDIHAVRLLAMWILLRLKLALVNTSRVGWQALREEYLVLMGTIRGVLYGIAARPAGR
jgi:hypothetical protein